MPVQKKKNVISVANSAGGLTFDKDIIIDDGLRKELSKPFGKLIATGQVSHIVKRGSVIYAVGDMTVSTLLKHGYLPKISVFDYKTGRRKKLIPIIRKTYKNPVRVRNGSGVLSIKLWKIVKTASRSKSAVGIRVYGEEDLAALACIYFAREGDLVMYGLRGRGLVVIKVGPRIKAFVLSVIKRMIVACYGQKAYSK